jgi:hypothetical protein
MLQMAQEMFKAIQDRFRSTLRVMANLAESVGVPSTVTGLFTGKEAGCCEATEESWADSSARAGSEPSWSGPDEEARPDDKPRGDNGRSAAAHGRSAARAAELGVRPLKVDDAIGGSTYLARIIWSLGVAELEGTGPLRPADMARMIMSRSPVSLEPPNVARYIRRSKPSCIEVAHTEGSSSFYSLNAEGKALFEDLFRNK